MIEDVEPLIYASTVQEVWSCLTQEARELGFPFVHYTLYHVLAADGFAMPKDIQFLSTLEPALIERFSDADFLRNAPLSRWLSQNSGAQSWDWIYDQWQRGLLSQAEKAALQVFLEAGHFAGWGFSLRGIAPRLGGTIVFGGPKGLPQPELDRLWALHGRRMTTLAALAHVRIASLPSWPITIEALTQRQREVLEWISAGKSNTEVAAILNISIPTVEKHLRLARQALGVRSTAQAIVLATVRNLIFTSESRPFGALSKVA